MTDPYREPGEKRTEESLEGPLTNAARAWRWSLTHGPTIVDYAVSVFGCALVALMIVSVVVCVLASCAMLAMG